MPAVKDVNDWNERNLGEYIFLGTMAGWIWGLVYGAFLVVLMLRL